MPHSQLANKIQTDISIDTASARLTGILDVPSQASGTVIFIHGNASNRHCPTHRRIAHSLRLKGMATLRFDLLTSEEKRREKYAPEFDLDIDQLVERLRAVTAWVSQCKGIAGLPVAYFGADTGAAAALGAASKEPERVSAIVSRDGRVDLAADALPRVVTPTLLIVRNGNPLVAEINQQACTWMHAPRQLEIVPGTDVLFDETACLGTITSLTCSWFARHLRSDHSSPCDVTEPHDFLLPSRILVKS